jgi:hypothetical protein
MADNGSLKACPRRRIHTTVEEVLEAVYESAA